MKRPWYKRYPADFIHGCTALSLEEKGAYSLLLDLMYDRAGPIPDDARWIARVCGCSTRKWNTIRARLIELGKINVHDGTISNARAEKEIESAANFDRKPRESPLKTARKSSENATVPKENNSLAKKEASYAGAYQKPEAREEGGEERARATRAADLVTAEAEALCGFDDPKNLPAGMCGFRDRIEAGMRAGWTREDVINGVRKGLASLSGVPPDSFKYFEKPIARALAERTAPIPTIEVPHAQATDHSQRVYRPPGGQGFSAYAKRRAVEAG